MADNKFLKVMKDAATDRGIDIVLSKTTPPMWASLTTGLDEERVTVEVDFDDDGQGNDFWIANVYEGPRLYHVKQFTGDDTASLFRLLGTWLG